MPGRIRAAVRVGAFIGMCMSAACDWPWKHDMRDQPSLQTETSPRVPAPGSLPTNGQLPLDRNIAEQSLRNPLAGARRTDIGRRLYNVYCSPCHGISGTGDGPVTRFFVPPGDLTAPGTQNHSDGWIYATITNGTVHMPRQGTELSPQERWEIVNFVRGLGAPQR